MTEPIKYIARPTEVHAVRLTQYGAFIRARDWVNETQPGGLSAYFVAKSAYGPDQLVLADATRTVYAFEDDVLVQSQTGRFSVWSEIEFADAFERGFDPPPTEAPEQTRGKLDTSLIGGGAPRLPE